MAIHIQGSVGATPIPVSGSIGISSASINVGTIAIGAIEGTVHIQGTPTISIVSGTVGITGIPTVSVKSGTIDISSISMPSSHVGTVSGIDVYGTPVLVADANDNRIAALFRNAAGTNVYFGFVPTVTASAGSADSGFQVAVGDAYEINQTKLYKGSVYAVAPIETGPSRVNKVLL